MMEWQRLVVLGALLLLFSILVKDVLIVNAASQGVYFQPNNSFGETKMKKLIFTLAISILLIVGVVVFASYRSKGRVQAGKQQVSRKLVSTIPGVKVEAVSDVPTFNNLDKLSFDLVNETDKTIYYLEFAIAQNDKTTNVLGFYSQGKRAFKAKSRERIDRLVAKDFAVSKEFVLRTVVFDDGSYIGLEHVGKKIVAERHSYQQIATRYSPLFEAYRKASKSSAAALGQNIIKLAKAEIEMEKPQEVGKASTEEQYVAGFAKNSRVNALLDVIHRVELIEGEAIAGKDDRERGVKATLQHLQRFN